MRATLEFNLDEEREKFEMTIKALDYHCALFDTAQDIFRPHRKHGYTDQKLQDMIDAPQDFVGTKVNEDGYEYELEEISDVVTYIIGQLESKFYAILNQYGVEI